MDEDNEAFEDGEDEHYDDQQASEKDEHYDDQQASESESNDDLLSEDYDERDPD